MYVLRFLKKGKNELANSGKGVTRVRKSQSKELTRVCVYVSVALAMCMCVEWAKGGEVFPHLRKDNRIFLSCCNACTDNKGFFHSKTLYK